MSSCVRATSGAGVRSLMAALRLNGAESMFAFSPRDPGAPGHYVPQWVLELK